MPGSAAYKIVAQQQEGETQQQTMPEPTQKVETSN